MVEAHERHHRRHVIGGGDAKADLALEFVQNAGADLEAADTRLTATPDALDSIPVQAPHDALLDFALALRDSIRGHTKGAQSVEDVNHALIETFDSFVI